ncbi:unnamed protein product [Boreogadus saida]
MSFKYPSKACKDRQHLTLSQSCKRKRNAPSYLSLIFPLTKLTRKKRRKYMQLAPGPSRGRQWGLVLRLTSQCQRYMGGKRGKEKKKKKPHSSTQKHKEIINSKSARVLQSARPGADRHALGQIDTPWGR